MKIVVATHNEGKLPEIRNIIEAELGQAAQHIELVSAGSMNLPDPVETGVTFEQNALLKARDVARRTGLPALADDSGLIVDVLGAAPGILSARWSGVHGDDEANIDLLLAQIADIPDDKRGARFNCAAALVVPKHCGEERANGTTPKAEETVKLGEMRGVVIREPRGENGFGYDPIFVPDNQPGRRNANGEKLTSAEMTAEEKNAISHRHKAFVALAPEIKELIG
ncbi:RdgB/HAM1 family non-canonical purine NTP pyrophosphatase [Bifidobacterium sp. ESL0798]|uniref:RdgB/HAM1 family non-canonical purine NTP pyrophosphatase n=1 Tax=Bifidobacterium sp. ESL0798 TaxID=2983235 RepID=UPI0023F899F7|nr:RdgB/HAM1 family non-canonical purine NTP pyrophosphatase [Bifidobacterium sp. ESL0798]WEV73779.1 RdgB/HAM1 family non-canonical purine NTP pyrophosphatase [Bifidobacterium sp. ESL0798]